MIFNQSSNLSTEIIKISFVENNFYLHVERKIVADYVNIRLFILGPVDPTR